ncbi:MAG: hypothetical protein Q7T55_05260, partial [Solirubrobacteraceae bacterium]|nr:hypothetical protein [Solirubrobacteraceae bacterium]
GWIDGSNTFRTVRTSSNGGAPTKCVSPTLLRRHEVELQLTTLVGNPTTSERSILGSVVWGSTGGAVPALSLTTGGRRSMVRPSEGRGGFIAFYGPDASPADVQATARYADGRTTSTSLMPQPGQPGSSIPAGRDLFPQVDPSTRRIIARAPDPGGGPSVGLDGVRSKAGVWCVGEVGSIVGDRVGTIDPILGLLSELDARLLSTGCPADPAKRFQAGGVLTVGGTGGGQEAGQELLDPAGAALRLQPGRAILYGQAREDVELLTITTSRDVRSLVPTGPAHAFIVSYDGSFSSGGIEVVATLEDGSTRTTTLNYGW